MEGLQAYYDDGAVAIYNGHVIDVLKALPDESIQLVISSPPYWGLRCYQGGTDIVWGGDADCEHEWLTEKHFHNWERKQSPPTGIASQAQYEATGYLYANFCSKCGAWRGQLGLEPTPELYVEHLMMIFREVKRVLKKDGSFYLNIGDTYMSHPANSKNVGGFQGKQMEANPAYKDSIVIGKHFKGMTDKCMVCIPERVMFAMIADGWILRNKNIWHKPNPLPGSQKDRFSTTWEYLYFFVKNGKTILWRNRETGEWRDTRPTKDENYPWGGMYQHVGTGEFRWDKPPEGERDDWVKSMPLWMGFDYYFDLDSIRIPHSSQSLKRYMAGMPKSSLVDKSTTALSGTEYSIPFNVASYKPIATVSADFSSTFQTSSLVALAKEFLTAYSTSEELARQLEERQSLKFDFSFSFPMTALTQNFKVREVISGFLAVVIRKRIEMVDNQPNLTPIGTAIFAFEISPLESFQSSSSPSVSPIIKGSASPMRVSIFDSINGTPFTIASLRAKIMFEDLRLIFEDGRSAPITLYPDSINPASFAGSPATQVKKQIDLFGHGPNPQSFNLRVRDVKRGKGGATAQGGELKASQKEIEEYEYPEKARKDKQYRRRDTEHQITPTEAPNRSSIDWRAEAAKRGQLFDQPVAHQGGENTGLKKKEHWVRPSRANVPGRDELGNTPPKEARDRPLVAPHHPYRGDGWERQAIEGREPKIKHDQAVGRTGNVAYTDPLHTKDYSPKGKNPGDILSARQESIVSHFEQKGSGGHYLYGSIESPEGKHEHPLGKNPGDVFQAKKEPYLINNPHTMRLKKDRYIALDPEHPNDLSHAKGKNPGDVIEGRPPVRDDKRAQSAEKQKMHTFYTHSRRGVEYDNPLGKNPGDYWEITTQPFKGAHFAVFPEKLCKRPILASSRVGDVVLDPLAGSGTVAVVAKKLGRKAIIIDCVESYCAISKDRVSKVEYQQNWGLSDAYC